MKGNGSWRRNLLTGRAEISQSIACPHACVIANPAACFLIKFRLTDHASIMFTKVIHRLRLAFLPFQTERRTAITEFKVLFFATMRTRYIKRIKCADSFAAFSIWHDPLTFGVEPRMDLGQTEPSIRLSPAASANLLSRHPAQR